MMRKANIRKATATIAFAIVIMEIWEGLPKAWKRHQ
jgi:hypothetical protein